MIFPHPDAIFIKDYIQHPVDGVFDTPMIPVRDLEQENARLKRLVADLSLDNAIIKEALKGK